MMSPTPSSGLTATFATILRLFSCALFPTPLFSAFLELRLAWSDGKRETRNGNQESACFTDVLVIAVNLLS